MSEALPHKAYRNDPDGKYRDWLVRAVKKRGARRVAEVGCFAGATTIKIARETDAIVWAIDHFQGVPGDPVQAGIYRDMERTEAFFRHRLADFIDVGRVVLLKKPSTEAARWLMDGFGRFLDFVFIDADHSEGAVKDDIRAWLPLVKPGGVLCGHDLPWPGVERAVRSELGDGWKAGADGFIWWTEAKE